jgi:hypothetical protein
VLRNIRVRAISFAIHSLSAVLLSENWPYRGERGPIVHKVVSKQRKILITEAVDSQKSHAASFYNIITS